MTQEEKILQKLIADINKEINKEKPSLRYIKSRAEHIVKLIDGMGVVELFGDLS